MEMNKFSVRERKGKGTCQFQMICGWKIGDAFVQLLYQIGVACALQNIQSKPHSTCSTCNIFLCVIEIFFLMLLN